MAVDTTLGVALPNHIMLRRFLGALGRRVKSIPRQAMVRRQLRHPQGPIKLHLGCGTKRLDGYINIDHNPGDAVDYVCDIARLPCAPASVERIETYHVIEHIPHRVAATVLRHWFSILRPGGVLVTECPDFDACVTEYLAGKRDMLWSIFGRQRFHGDAHYFGYSVKSLSELLVSVGFGDIQSHPARDYHALTEPCIRIECAKPRDAR